VDFVRFYTDDDGTSRAERIDPIRGAEWSKGFASSACSVRAMAPGTLMDWHPAPRRQIVVHLSGLLEIVLRDGTVVPFGPGSARLMDDLTGTGHLTRVVGDQPVEQMVIALTG
jgi:hypothetical protein